MENTIQQLTLSDLNLTDEEFTVLLQKEKIQYSTPIYRTENYDIFKFINGNRYINSLNFTKLLKSMEKKQLKIPICVNEKMQVIDGVRHVA